jgi:hypothetical protein
VLFDPSGNVFVSAIRPDQFGARAKPNGDVIVYKNGTAIGTRNVSSWQYYDDGGYIGVWFIAAEDAVLDNFGGGTAQGGQGVTQGRGNLRNRIAGQEKGPDPYDVELTNAELFWQGIPLGSELTTKVTFTQLDKSAARQKPQSNGMWGEDVIQIMYDVPNHRIQVWKFEGKAWVQVGNDIPVKFVDGDVFTVFAGKDGTVEITRNGRLLSTRQPVALPITTPTSTQASPTPTMTEAPIKQDASAPQLANFAPVSFKLPAPVSAPQQQSGSVTINYVYDPLYRLTEANYSTGDYYHYTYDTVGNRLTQETLIGSVPLTTSYVYDAANRLTSVDSVPYTWDNNGNLLNDGVNNYTYDAANQLTAMSGPFGSSTFAYNGMGDRLSQNGVNYTLDLNSGLTQVLSDGTNQYLYGVGRISQVNTTTLITDIVPLRDYFLTDALGSVRQLTDSQGEVTRVNAYEPYGSVSQSAGNGTSPVAYTGEQVDVSGGRKAPYNYFLHHDGLFPDHLFPKWHYVFAVDFLHGESLGLNRFENPRGGNAQDFQSLAMAEGNPIIRNDDQVNVAPFAGGPCRLRAVKQNTRRANPQFRQLLAVPFDDALKFGCCFNH